jgi:hypothetical protein
MSKEREHCEAVAREATGCGRVCSHEADDSAEFCCVKVASLVARERAAARAEALESAAREADRFPYSNAADAAKRIRALKEAA